MTNLILLIAQTALQILIQQQVGGTVSSSASSLLNIISLAKAAYEKEVGEPLDISKIRPYTPI